MQFYFSVHNRNSIIILSHYLINTITDKNGKRKKTDMELLLEYMREKDERNAALRREELELERQRLNLMQRQNEALLALLKEKK